MGGDDSAASRRLADRDDISFGPDDILTADHIPILVADVQETITVANTATHVALGGISQAQRSPASRDPENTIGAALRQVEETFQKFGDKTTKSSSKLLNL